MPESWDQNATYTDFIFLGFSGSKEWRQHLLIMFAVMFSISVPANILLIFTITSKKSLHSRMYVLIGILSAVDLSLPFIFIPNFLKSLVQNIYNVSLLGCLTQMFLLHFLGCLQSTILLWMAIDRYYAICRPLHYMPFRSFLKFVMIPLIRNTIFIFMIVCLAGSQAYCRKEINHCFCEQMALVSLACGSTRVDSVVGITATFCIRFADFLLVSSSYIKIFFTAFQSGNGSRKGLRTCLTQMLVMTLGLIFALTAFLAYRIKNEMSSNNRIVLSTMYLLFPSCFHPVIYGYMIKEIRVNIINILQPGKVDPPSFTEKVKSSPAVNSQ